MERNGNDGFKPSHGLNIIPKGCFCFVLLPCNKVSFSTANYTSAEEIPSHEFLLWMQRRGSKHVTHSEPGVALLAALQGNFVFF